MGSNSVREGFCFKIRMAWVYSGLFKVICIIFIIVLIFSVLYALLPGNKFLSGYYSNVWSNVLDPVFSIGTGFLAFMIYLIESYESWKGNLEKRLYVDYYYKGSKIMCIEDAYLAGESDIRQWSQQLGKQLCGQDLSFDMAIEFHRDIVKKEQSYYNNFKVKYYLDENPIDNLKLYEDEEVRKIKIKGKNHIEKKMHKLISEEYNNSIVNRSKEMLSWKRK